MVVEALDRSNTVDDMDEDDVPLVFKRSSSSTKQQISKSEIRKESTMTQVRSQNGQSNSLPNHSTSPVKSVKMDSKRSASAGDVNPSPEATNKANLDSDDSDDDKPLSVNLLGQKPKIPKSEYSDDKTRLSAIQAKSSSRTTLNKHSPNSAEKRALSSQNERNGSTSVEKKPPTILTKRPSANVSGADQKRPKLANASTPNKNAGTSVKSEVKEEDDEKDHFPISQMKKKPDSSAKKPESAKKVSKPQATSSKLTIKKEKKVTKTSEYRTASKVPPSSGDGQKWTTLVHNGVIFPPPYKSHGVKMLYKGKPVDLTPEQEEVATMFAVMLDTDYMSKPQFKENFMADWRKILGKKHVIQDLEHCDFTPIYEWHQKEKEKKKQMTTEEKKAIKEEKLKQEEKYMWAIVDGVKEKVGNFRVEPPGLFRGRGEHPKMGKLKRRIHPSDITVNIGKDALVPDCPIEGESWKEIRHDNTVTWLAYWNDPINPKEVKYVFLAPSSTLKGQSDKEKYEKARLLKDYISGIRAAYTRDFTSREPMKKQIAVATYLIDKLALRAGNEKDDDEADTVGCCTLKVENVEPVPPNVLKFDFLGKDSIRYENEVEVELAVFKAVQQFRSGKDGGDDLFDLLDTSKLNTHLKELMPGLTAKVFRTYNASITLDEMLSKQTRGGDIAEKVVVYQAANKEVAIICNHQRTVSKSFSAQMSRLDEKIEELKAMVDELKSDLTRAKKGKPPLKSADGTTKRNSNPEAIEKKISQATARIEKLERDKVTKDELKTVALGTSKTNYLDPRITVAWCKRFEVPIEKMFTKTLLAKFAWAMDVDPSFRF